MQFKHREMRTRHYNIFLVAIAALAAGGLIWTIVGARAHTGPFGAGEAGSSAARHGHAITRLCSKDRDAWIEGFVAYVEHAVDVAADQRDAWKNLVNVARDVDVSIDAVCADLGTAGTTRTTPEMLAIGESTMTAGLDALRALRPPFEAFYAILRVEQRETLDGLLSRHRN